jgi:spermidine/putrescine-binding protein
MNDRHTGFDRRQFLKTASALGVGGLAGVSANPWAYAALPGPLRVNTIVSIWAREKDIKPFEQANGTEVKLTAWVSNIHQVTKTATGGTKLWDVITMINIFTDPVLRRKLFQPLDLREIPNAAQLWPQFQKPTYGMYDGVQYGLPYVWGYDSILFNKGKIPKMESWKDMFDDRYKGRIALRDDPQFGLPIAALALGVKDPFALGSDELKEIKAFLVAKKPVIRKLWTGFAEALTLMRTGEVDAMMGWLPMWRILKKEGMNVDFIIPSEKAFGWVHVYLVSKETKVLPTAYKFLDYVLDTPFSSSIAKDLAYFSPSRKVLAGLTDAEVKELRYDRIDEIQKSLIWGDVPVNLQEWNDTWSAFKAA